MPANASFRFMLIVLYKCAAKSLVYKEQKSNFIQTYFILIIDYQLFINKYLQSFLIII